MDVDYFKKTFIFSQSSSLPLYEQLASYMRIQIQSGVLKPGEQMISESELCNILNISRTTVRLSMNRLVSEGLLVRYRGKGSFIAEQKLRRNVNYMYNFTQSMNELGAVPTSIVLECQKIEADDVIAKVLQLPPSSNSVFKLVRLRCANGIPLLKECTYIPYFLCPGIENIDFQLNSLYNILSIRYALKLYHAVETIESVILPEEDKKHLEYKKNIMAGFKIERISSLESGLIFEFTQSLTRADKCALRLDLYKDRNGNKNSVDFERRLQT